MRIIKVWFEYSLMPLWHQAAESGNKAQSVSQTVKGTYSMDSVNIEDHTLKNLVVEVHTFSYSHWL